MTQDIERLIERLRCDCRQDAGYFPIMEQAADALQSLCVGTKEGGTPRADHYRAEFKRRKETSDLIEWMLNEFTQTERRLRAALSEREGCVMVPREPTEKMLAAASMADNLPGYPEPEWAAGYAELYKAMLSAHDERKR